MLSNSSATTSTSELSRAFDLVVSVYLATYVLGQMEGGAFFGLVDLATVFRG